MLEKEFSSSFFSDHTKFHFETVEGFARSWSELLKKYETPGIESWDESRKREFLLGRFCAEKAFERFKSSGDWSVKKDEKGAPLWPAGWIGSISHSKGNAIAVVSKSDFVFGVGVDLEVFRESASAEKIQKKIAKPHEFSVLKTLPKEVSPIVMASAKEAIFKAIHPKVGKFFGFQAMELISASETNSEYLTLVFAPDETFASNLNLPRSLEVKTQVFSSFVISLIEIFNQL